MSISSSFVRGSGDDLGGVLQGHIVDGEGVLVVAAGTIAVSLPLCLGRFKDKGSTSTRTSKYLVLRTSCLGHGRPSIEPAEMLAKLT